MRNIALAGLALLALAGCSSHQPLIDHINVSDAKYSRDMAACRDATSSGWLPFAGGSVADCMKGKGYTVLMGNGGL